MRPKIEGCWPKRIAAAKNKLQCQFGAAVPFETVSDLVHAAVILRRIREGGGEGLILRRPGAGYSTTRTNDVVKIKKCPKTGELAWRGS
jgi:ATP-dependent DNA ligase